jgi:hypothetical protein
LHAGKGDVASNGTNTTKSRPWDAVIFDYGEVLSYPPFHRELGQSSGLDKPSFFTLYSNTRGYYGRSPAEYKPHWLQVADALGLQVSFAPIEELVVLESDLWTRPNAEVLEPAREIKGARRGTAIPSNMALICSVDCERSWNGRENLRSGSGHAKKDIPSPTPGFAAPA